MCHTPELAAEVTLMPIRKFDFDAAILFSDILVIPEAMKVGLRFEDGAGPIIERPVRTSADVEALFEPDVQTDLGYVSEAIKLLQGQLTVPLLGFAGAPFTVASYMIEGKSSRDLRLTKQWLMNNPKGFHRLLEKITQATIDYLNMQIEAGVQALQIFDSWAHVLSSAHFREFSLHYLDKIMRGLTKRDHPVILYCKGSSVFAGALAEISPACISLDWNADMGKMRQFIPKGIALQGNLDPDILSLAPPQMVRSEVKNLLHRMNNEPGFVFNLGHGILPDTPIDSVKVLVDAVKG